MITASPDFHGPVLPRQLAAGYDDAAGAVYERWQNISAEAVVRATPESEVYVPSDDPAKGIRYAIVGPEGIEPDTDQTAVMTLPIGKTWNPEAFLVSSIVQALTVPDGRLIVFPNNNLGQRSYAFSEREQHIVSRGNLAPLSERQLRALEHLGISSLDLVLGRSQGAAVGASLGWMASDYLQLKAFGLDEAPNTFLRRGPLGLRLSVVREKEEIVPAIRAAKLPAMDGITHIDDPKLYNHDLRRFLIGGNLLPQNRALNNSFRHANFFDDVLETQLNNPDTATFFISNAASSTVGNKAETEEFVYLLNKAARDDVARYFKYDGHHITAFNPFVLGALGKEALAFHAAKLRSGQGGTRSGSR